MLREQAERVAAKTLSVKERVGGYGVVFNGPGHRNYYTWRPMKPMAEAAHVACVSQLAVQLEGWEIIQGGKYA